MSEKEEGGRPGGVWVAARLCLRNSTKVKSVKFFSGIKGGEEKSGMTRTVIPKLFVGEREGPAFLESATQVQNGRG